MMKTNWKPCPDCGVRVPTEDCPGGRVKYEVHVAPCIGGRICCGNGAPPSATHLKNCPECRKVAA